MLIVISINLVELVLEKIILQRMFSFKKKTRISNNFFFWFSLSESETKTIMHIFSDHAGVVIDPFGVGVSDENIVHVTTVPDVHGVRISPRQSPMYQPMVNKSKFQINLFSFLFLFSFSLFMVQH
jgi:hypothetical protein